MLLFHSSKTKGPNWQSFSYEKTNVWCFARLRSKICFLGPDYMEIFNPGMKILKKIQLGKILFWINGVFSFHSGMKLKLRLNSGSASRDEIFNFLDVIVICFWYWKQWQGEMKSKLGCVIIISSWDEIFDIISSLGCFSLLDLKYLGMWWHVIFNTHLSVSVFF